MHIKKQRLLTPGPTPLYPPALRAMMASDIHHPTEDFRAVYKSVPADLNKFMGTMPLDIDGWGLDVVIGGSQKAFMVPPGVAFLSVSPKAWKRAETATLPHFYFNLKKEKKSGDNGESSWTPSTAVILALAEAL